MRACHLPSAPAVAVAEFSPMATRTESPGSDHPQIAFGLPRWRTMLSPKIGLTNGSGAAVWGGAPKALPPASARTHASVQKALLLALGNLISMLPQSPSMSNVRAARPHVDYFTSNS